MKRFHCPHCGNNIPLKDIASHLGTMGGAKGGVSRSEAKRHAARINLEKARAEKERRK